MDLRDGVTVLCSGIGFLLSDGPRHSAVMWLMLLGWLVHLEAVPPEDVEDAAPEDGVGSGGL